MKVFVVTSCTDHTDSDGLRIIAVCDSRKTALQKAEEAGITIEDELDEDYHIHEIEVNQICNIVVHYC